MNSDEEAELDEARTALKELLGSRKVPQDQLDEAIYHYDFDLDKAASYLISKLEKEQEKQRLQQEKETQIRQQKEKEKEKEASIGKSISYLPADNSVPRNEQEESKPPTMSKLQLLAAARKGNKSSLPLNNSGAGSPPPVTLPSSKPKSSLASLSAKYSASRATTGSPSSQLLEKLKKPVGGSEPPVTGPSVIGNGKFSLRSARAKESARATQIATSRNLKSESNNGTESVQNYKTVKCFPQVSSAVLYDYTMVDPSSFSPVVVVLCEPSTTKSTSPQLTKIANSVYSAEKAKSAFVEPSPDDIVLTAQSAGFQKQPPAKEKEQAVKAVPEPTVSKIDMVSRLAELSLKKSKNSASFVVVGHVDAGKSTLMGRLLLDSGNVDQHLVDKYTKQSGDIGKGSFALAWVMDQTEEERNRGVTIDICVSSFDTPKTHFTIVDAPGHRDFVPNMIAGSSQADLAVLVVDASTNAFESGFSLDGQTKEHAILLRSLGVDSMVVAVNKLDTLEWEQSRFDDICSQLKEFLTRVGFQAKNLYFVPTSGLNGDNVVKKSTNPKAQWYTGEPVLGLLESWTEKRVAKSNSADSQAEFLMFVSDVYTGSHSSNLLVSGRIETGAVQVGDSIAVSPSGIVCPVKAIDFSSHSTSKKQDFGVPGDLVTLNVGQIPLDQVSVGDVVSHTVIGSSSLFTARIVVFDLKRPILTGSKMVFHRGRTNVPCKISKLVSIVDKASGEVTKKKPRHLSSGQTAVVQIELQDALPLRTFYDSKQLGRFVLRKEGSTLAAGIVDTM